MMVQKRFHPNQKFGLSKSIFWGLLLWVSGKKLTKKQTLGLSNSQIEADSVYVKQVDMTLVVSLI